MAEKDKMAIVLFHGDLDHALAAYFLATTGASMGMEVNMFFTFWGLNVIKRNEGSIKSKGFMHRMFNIINRGGTKRLKLSQFNMLGMGPWMMKRMMKEVNVPSLDEFISMAHDMGVNMYACTTTCGLMGGLGEDAFRAEVTSLAGAAFFLNEARQSKISLFI